MRRYVMRSRKIDVALVAVAGIALATGCGKKDDDDGGDAIGVPASIVTEAELTPVALVAYDAAKIKTTMETGGSGGFRAEHPADTSEPDCEQKLSSALVVEAAGSVAKVSGVVDLAACELEEIKANPLFAGGDFSGLVIDYRLSYLLYMKCEGADLSGYNGKTHGEFADGKECDKSSKNSMKAEFSYIKKISGVIKGTGTSKVDQTYEQDWVWYYAKRAKGGGPCVATVSGAEWVFADDCEETSLSLTNKMRVGPEGNIQEGQDVGKAEYSKHSYVGLKKFVENKGPWFSGGKINVVHNDWTGVVTYSSPTAEPIFEMKKGNETQNGTMKETE